MEILHVMSGDGGGISTYVKSLLRFRTEKINYTILSFTDYSNEFIEISKETNSTLLTMPRPKNSGWIHFFKKMNNHFNKKKYDLIISHIPGVYAIPFYFFSKINGSNFFGIHSHQTRFVYGRKMNLKEKIFGFLNPLFNRVLAQIKFSCSEEAALYAFNTNKNVNVIHNSVDTEIFLEYYNHNTRLEADKITVGHIGRHTPAKNIDFIINLAMYIKNKEINDIEILMIGNGELTKSIIQSVKVKKLNDIIKILGRTDEVEKALNNFNVLLLPSYSEGFPTVLIESQATGTFSIVSDTITKEVDLDLGLISYLPIDKEESNYDRWLKEIYHNAIKEKPDASIVEKSLFEKNLDSTLMTQKFEEIVRRIDKE